MKIPDRYLKRIPEGLNIEWAGRRRFYEVVEELGDAIFHIIAFLWFISVLHRIEFIDITNWQTSLGIVFFIVILAAPAWLEIEKWYAEYYLVCRHSDRDGGVVYRFDGIINPNRQDINISPIMDMEVYGYKNNIFYWIWKTLTNNKMERVTIKTAPSKYLINNKRIDPGYSDAIGRVQHSPAPHRVAKDVPFWANVDGLIRLRNSDGIDDDRFREISDKLLDSLVGESNGQF